MLEFFGVKCDFSTETWASEMLYYETHGLILMFLFPDIQIYPRKVFVTSEKKLLLVISSLVILYLF